MLQEMKVRNRIAGVCLCLRKAEDIFKVIEEAELGEYDDLKKLFTAFEFQGAGGIPHKDEARMYSVARQLRFARKYESDREGKQA